MYIVFFEVLDKKIYYFEVEMFYMKQIVGMDCGENVLSLEFFLNIDFC